MIELRRTEARSEKSHVQIGRKFLHLRVEETLSRGEVAGQAYTDNFEDGFEHQERQMGQWRM